MNTNPKPNTRNQKKKKQKQPLAIPYKPLPPIPVQNKYAAKKETLGLKSAPVAMQRVRKVAEPRFVRSMKNGDITVEHEEFVTDINGSILFANTSVAVNPGISTSFPWLSLMAPLYESYRFEKLEYRFESASGTTSTGTLMMAIDYDASDPPAVQKSQLSTYRGYVRSAPWEECCCESDREDLNKQKSYFVRTGNLSANQDIKLYDTGNLNVATQGQAGASNIGELYVRYRVKLMTPQLLINGLGLAQSFRSFATAQGGATTQSGNAPLVSSGTGAAITLTSTGVYQSLAVVNVVGTGLVSTTFSGTATIVPVGNDLNAAATGINAAALVNFTAPGQTLIVTTANTTITAINVRLGQYDVSLS